MKILLANPRGFCAGVDRAIDIVERAIELFGAPIYVRHEVVHNRFVVDDLKQKGAIFVEELHEVPDGATVIFSAHGVSKAIQAEAAGRDLKVFDATCPLVTKVHMEVMRYRKRGTEVILIGHEGHPEVDGTMGQSDSGMHLIEDPADAGPKKDDICYATQNRQDAVKSLSRDADVVIVVGSTNSSNSNRLRELSETLGVPSYLVDQPTQLEQSWFDGVDTVGITAGASAPEILVKQVIDQVKLWGGKVVNEASGPIEDISFSIPIELRVE